MPTLNQASWPAPREEEDGIRWNIRRLSMPVLLSLALLLGAYFIPMQKAAATIVPPAEKPLAWKQLEELIDELKENQALDESEIWEKII